MPTCRLEEEAAAAAAHFSIPFHSIHVLMMTMSFKHRGRRLLTGTGNKLRSETDGVPRHRLSSIPRN
jgi:hypothetical protein